MLSVCAGGSRRAKAVPGRKCPVLFSTTDSKCCLLPPPEGKKQNQWFMRSLGRIAMSFQPSKALWGKGLVSSPGPEQKVLPQEMAKAQEMHLKLTLIIGSAHLYGTFLSFLLSLSLIFHSTQPTLPSAIVLKHQPRFGALLRVSYAILKVQIHPP